MPIHLKLEFYATRAKVTDHPRKPLLVIYTNVKFSVRVCDYDFVRLLECDVEQVRSLAT